MGIILLPAVLYALLHLLGWQYPVLLWGVDQLHYYPVPVVLVFLLVGLAGLTVAVRSSWAQRLDQALVLQVERFAGSPFAVGSTKAILLLLFVAVAYTFRVRSHLLGDSSMWFSLLDEAWQDLAQQGTSWWGSLFRSPGFADRPGFGQQAYGSQRLDVFIHFQLYRLGKHWLGWTAADSYAYLSCLAGAFYALILWKTVSRIAPSMLSRLTLLGLSLTLGSVQLFFGYGESYTLVHLVSAWYVCAALGCLKGGSLWSPSLLLGLAGALHLQALSLLPSWAYLVWCRWRRPVPSCLRRPTVYVPLLLAVGLVGMFLYSTVYPSPLPFFSPREEGTFAVFSPGHLLTLANALLLLSPFGLVWGAVWFRPGRVGSSAVAFLAWSAVGSGLLIVLHNAFYAGRDWDLLAFPALFYTLWGSMSLDQEQLRRVRWAVLPLMLAHTSLWIGINADPARAIDRLVNLLESPGQSRHYQQFSLGYCHLMIRNDARAAVPYFIAAIAYSPNDEQDPQKLRNRYRKFLGCSLAEIGEYGDAAGVFRVAFRIQPALYGRNDVNSYRAFVRVLLGLAGEYYQQGRVAEADSLWEEAAARSQQIIEGQPEAAWCSFRGTALSSLGRLEGAIAAFRQAVSLEPDPEKRYATCLDLAKVLSLSGDARGAVNALEEALRAKPEKRGEVERFVRELALPAHVPPPPTVGPAR